MQTMSHRIRDLSAEVARSEVDRHRHRLVDPARCRRRALASRIASASARGERYDGVLAFSQGGNLLTIMLGLLEAGARRRADAREAAWRLAGRRAPPRSTMSRGRAWAARAGAMLSKSAPEGRGLWWATAQHACWATRLDLKQRKLLRPAFWRQTRRGQINIKTPRPPVSRISGRIWCVWVALATSRRDA